MQGNLVNLEGIALPGLQADSTTNEAFRRMPRLRILILDGVKLNSKLSGFQLPRLAMLSWREVSGPLLPFATDIITAAAVLDISDSTELERLPLAMLQTHTFS